MSGPVKPTQFFADFQGLAALKHGAKNEQPDALKKAANQFESLFTRMMLKNMRAASQGNELFDSEQTQFYQDMFDDQLAVHLSQGKGMGLADMLVKQLRQGSEMAADGNTGRPEYRPEADKRNSLTLPTRPAAVVKSHSQAVAGVDTAPLQRGHSESSNNAGTTSSAGDYRQLHHPLSLKGEGQGEGFRSSDDFGVTALMHSRSVPTRANTVAAEITAEAAVTKTEKHEPAAARTPRTRTSVASSPQEFIQRMLPLAQKAARALGVDPHALVAQAALETGWGKSVPCGPDGSCSYNLFGIKATSQWNGQSVGARTLEFESGIPVAKRARFRSYGSAEESFRDYAALIANNDRYVGARNTGANVQAFANALQKGGYATDPQYARKLSAVTNTVRNLAAEADVGDRLKFADAQPLTGREGVRG